MPHDGQNAKLFSLLKPQDGQKANIEAAGFGSSTITSVLISCLSAVICTSSNSDGDSDI